MDYLIQNNIVQEWHKHIPIPFSGIIIDTKLIPDNLDIKDFAKELKKNSGTIIYKHVPPMRNEHKSVNSIICDNYFKDEELDRK